MLLKISIMLKLLQVELKKILRRKSIYMIWTLMLIFCLLNNILYYTDYDDDGNYKYLALDNLEIEQKELTEELAKYNKDDEKEVTMYITIKTKLDILELKQKYSQNSWQYKKINTYLYDIIYQINNYKYIEIDEEKLKTLQKEYQVIIDKLDNNDYKYFLNNEIEAKTEIKRELNDNYSNETDEKIKQELSVQIADNNFELKILEYRLNNDIKEDTSYLNNALESYKENYKTTKYYYELGDNKTYQEKLAYQETLSSTKVSQYIVENRQNISKQNNLNYQLRTIVSDYELFLVMLILIVCSTIICDEFKDGTIKLLLIKPYSRCKILLSKYLTTIIVLIISILLLIIMQLVIGGFIFGFESLNIPVVVYNFTNSKLIEYSVFEYMLMGIAVKIPLLLMMITISYFLGVLTSSMIISITMPLMLYVFSSSLKYLAIEYELEFMKYLVNINWNIQDYLFGKLPEFQFVNFEFSMFILFIYFIILGVLTLIIFNKKNIKNI